jgi:hypothetical protein
MSLRPQAPQIRRVQGFASHVEIRQGFLQALGINPPRNIQLPRSATQMGVSSVEGIAHGEKYGFASRAWRC